MRRLVSLLTITVLVLGLVVFQPDSAAAMNCEDFSYQADAEVLAAALDPDAPGVPQLQLTDDSGAVCADVREPLDPAAEDIPLRLDGVSLPNLPRGATELEVKAVSGDFIQVKENISLGADNNWALQLANTFIPSWNERRNPDQECGGLLADGELAKLVLEGSTVWLDRDAATDTGDRYIGDEIMNGYVWIEVGDHFEMVNLLMIRDGFAYATIRKNADNYSGDFREVQQEAIDEGNGLWETCGNGTSPSSDESGASMSNGSSISSPVADCTPFADYDVAQEYYADHPEEQAVIDPDADGYACEVFFGVDPAGTTAPDTDSGSIVGSGSDNDAPVATQAPAAVEPPAAPGDNGGGLPAAGDYNCSDFSSQAQAQATFEAAGGGPGYNAYDLDSDGDGYVCESLG